MLKFIRRNAEAPWVKIMFGVIVVVFVFWGMGGIVGGEKAQVVARINNDTVDPTEYYRAYNNMLRFYQDIYKDNFKPELVKGLGLKDRALDQLIQASLLRHEAHRIGLRVSDTETREAIANLPAFQSDGRFNKELYVRTLRANRITPAEFEDNETDELLVKKLQDLILAGVYVSDADLHDRFQYENEKVNLGFIKFEAATFVPEVKLTDADVQAYYEKHQGKFREPDRVRLEYVLYDPEKFTDKVDVSETAVKQYFDSHRLAYEKPEQVHARLILFKVSPDTSDDLKADVRKHAEEVLAKVKAGGDFAALAKQYSEDATAADGGDLGFVERGKTMKEFDDVAFSLDQGATSNVVETPLGFEIIKVEAKKPARQETLDEVRDQVIEAMKKEKSQELSESQADADHDKVVGGASLASVAQASGLSVVTPSPFAQSEAIADLGREPKLVKAAFATDAGGVGPVVDTAKGLILFHVAEKIAAHVPPLADIRDRVESAVRTEQAGELAKKKAEAVLADVQKNGFDATAKADKLTVEETGPFTREGGYVPQIGASADLKKDAFELTKEKPVGPKVYTVSGSSVVVTLKERLPADEEKFKTDKDKLKQQAEERRKQQVLQDFINYLKARASIDVNRDFLASVTDSGRPLGEGPRGY